MLGCICCACAMHETADNCCTAVFGIHDISLVVRQPSARLPVANPSCIAGRVTKGSTIATLTSFPKLSLPTAWSHLSSPDSLSIRISCALVLQLQTANLSTQDRTTLQRVCWYVLYCWLISLLMRSLPACWLYYDVMFLLLLTIHQQHRALPSHSPAVLSKPLSSCLQNRLHAGYSCCTACLARRLQSHHNHDRVEQKGKEQTGSKQR